MEPFILHYAQFASKSILAHHASFPSKVILLTTLMTESEILLCTLIVTVFEMTSYQLFSTFLSSLVTTLNLLYYTAHVCLYICFFLVNEV